MNPWENDPYELPILADATYRCSCGCAANMDSFWGGPAYAHHKHYAIKCRMPSCKRSEIRMQDWKDTPAEAIRAWNRRCLERTTPTEEICARLGELGVEYDTYDLPNGEHGVSWIDGNSIEWEAVQQGENFRIHVLQLATPEQAIAATVGVGSNTREAIRKLLDKLSTELCYVGCGIECKTREERQRLIDAKKDKYAQAIAMMTGERNPDGLPVGLTISNDGNLLNWMGENYMRQDAATAGVDTCKCVGVTPNDWDEDLTMYHMECGFTMLHGEDKPRFCGGCGRRIEVSE